MTALTKAERDAIDALAFRIRCAAEHLMAAPLVEDWADIYVSEALAKLHTAYQGLLVLDPDMDWPPWPTTEEPT